MKTPVTYADWVEVFERFGKGEDVFDEMNAGHFELDAGTAQRFFDRAEEAYKTRKKLWLDNFQKNFRIEDVKTIEELEFVLQNNKKTVSVLSKFINAKGLPEKLKEAFQKDFTLFISEFKKNMKDNIGNDNKEKEKMLIVINSFNIGNAENLAFTEEKANVFTGRKIIF